MATTLLTTERLILRTWKASDIPHMAAINSDPIVMKHFPATKDLATTQAFIDYCIQHYKKFGYCFYAVELQATQELIGFVGLNQPSFIIPHFIPKSLPLIEIGWRLAAQHWYKGLATEAAKATLQHAFTVLNLDEIVSYAVMGNTPSRRVMEKIGMHHCTADDFDHPQYPDNPRLKHCVLYRLTQDEFRSHLATTAR